MLVKKKCVARFNWLITNQRIEEHTKFIDEQTTNQHFWTIKNNEVAVYAREKKVRGSKKKCVEPTRRAEEDLLKDFA